MTEGETRRTALESIRFTFGRGLAVIVPLVITLWVLNLLFTTIDSIISPIFDQLLGRHFIGLGFISMIVLIMIVGVLSRNLFGRTIFKYFERLMFSVPFVRTIYSSTKDLINALQAGSKGKSFRQVVLVEYPRLGAFTVGFVTNEISLKDNRSAKQLISVYIVNPPNPTSGAMVLVPMDNLTVLDISVEDALKLVLSGGIVTSGVLTVKSG